MEGVVPRQQESSLHWKNPSIPIQLFPHVVSRRDTYETSHGIARAQISDNIAHSYELIGFDESEKQDIIIRRSFLAVESDLEEPAKTRGAFVHEQSIQPVLAPLVFHISVIR